MQSEVAAEPGDAASEPRCLHLRAYRGSLSGGLWDPSAGPWDRWSYWTVKVWSQGLSSPPCFSLGTLFPLDPKAGREGRVAPMAPGL